MASSKDSIKNILVVALGVCLVASVVVSATAVFLKPTRVANKEADRYKNILVAAGLFQEGETPISRVDELFKQFEPRIVDLEENEIMTVEEAREVGIDYDSYDQRRASRNPDLSKDIPSREDIASIGRRARYSIIYLLKDGDQLDKVVLPVHGYGLWSTMYGFLALEEDMNTVAGITFYEQQETAGLGGEVDNPDWKAGWEGKQIYDGGDVALEVIKGSVDPGARNAEHKIDGLSGATLTSRGVQNLVQYWLGDRGFGPVLKQLETQDTQRVGAI